MLADNLIDENHSYSKLENYLEKKALSWQHYKMYKYIKIRKKYPKFISV